MRIVDLIERKRLGRVHDRAEIEQMVLGYTRGQVPDYQAAAWLMAVCWQGMAMEEVVALTEVMAASGKQLDLSTVGRKVADKHSTGGVGDKTSLVVMPLVAACGVPVGKMSGRGLGFTGGTIDKLECFRGIQLELGAEAFVRQLREVGLVITGQSTELAPSDGKLYALRDVTGTVSSLPLIASSIMSKKLAAGAQVILLDVKTGSGAFMRDPESARALAQMMVAIGRSAGREVAAVVTDMSQPLGRTVGNALEVREAIGTLRGNGPPDFQNFALELAAKIVRMAGITNSRECVLDAMQTGAALEKLRQMVKAQGGDDGSLDDASRLPTANVQRQIASPETGVLVELDALGVAGSATMLGAGREHKGDDIDLAAGIELHAKVGDRVARGQPLATLHSGSEERVDQALPRFLQSVRISGEPRLPPPLIREWVGEIVVA